MLDVSCTRGGKEVYDVEYSRGWGQGVCMMGPFALQPRLGPCLAQLGLGAGCCIYICDLPDLNQKFYVIVTPNESFVCYTSGLELGVPDGRSCRMECEPCSALLKN